MIFVYFFITHTFVSEVKSVDNFPLNLEIIDNILPQRTYNLNTDLSTPDIIRREGYPSEAHVISTEDGYLLTLHRIPGKAGSQSVLLQHGLLGSSSDWVITGSKKALAFILADNGYDVWLGNYRGNVYSRAHQNLSLSDSRFWDFSWHEMGMYDIPAMILYITNLKQTKLAYAGHSMGTTGFYVMSAMRPDVASRVKVMFSFAPVAYMTYLKSPIIRLFAPIARELQLTAHYLGEDQFLPENTLVRSIAKRACNLNQFQRKECANILFLICGYDTTELDEDLVPVIFGHTPAGTSTKTLVHYAQGITSSRFQHFDYGVQENLKIYNSPQPPLYDTTKITVPIALYYGDNDWLANVTDVLRLAKELRNVVDMYRIPYPKFNHLDFLWAKHAPELIYNRMLQTLKII
ncbi:hypothetical protein KPH14_008609 [Odynerus spinipes]|uniref:Lipase n=1 Tax=Odynerus spinipes TaxID=1348599 RepID=A0AAD9RSD9_9HYME|nr:hypothetical protein KPH14_008609 [Odynerus spinipes]